MWMIPSAKQLDSLPDILRSVLARLRTESRALTDSVRRHLGEGQIDSLVAALQQLSRACSFVEQALNAPDGVETAAAVEMFQTLRNELVALYSSTPPNHYDARKAVVRLLEHLENAESRLADLGYSEPIPQRRRIVVFSDTLFQLKSQLFPAERMQVVAGRTRGEVIQLGSAFPVTGESNAGHVRADPDSLGKALISMEVSGTHLAASAHSHPGTGPEATRPSTIDLNQQQDWLRDFSLHLLAIIFVADGWCRFWGDCLRRREVDLQLLGTGVRKGDEHGVYRLTFE